MTVQEAGKRQYEVACPWADQHTTAGKSARILLPDEEEGAFPAFNCFHAHCSSRSLKDMLEFFGKDAVDRHCRRHFGRGDLADRPVISPNDPLNAAREFHKRCFCHDGRPTIFYLESRWMLWNGRTYAEIMADDVRARLWHWLDTCCCRSKEGRLTKFLPNRSNVSGVFDALKAVANLPAGTDIPSWIGSGVFPMPENLVAFDNGLLDLRQIMAGEELTLLHIRPVGFRPIACPITSILQRNARSGWIS